MKKSHRNLLILCLVAASLAAGGWRYWQKELRDALRPRRFGVVEAGKLYRSGCIHPRLLPGVIERNGIKVIISLMGSYPPEEALAEQLGLERKEYLLKGNGTGDINIYADVIEDIVRANEQGKPVLVHCTAGTMRTGAAVIFYRVFVQGQTDSAAFVDELKAYDWKPRRTVLPEYINENMHILASVLKERGVIDDVPHTLPQIEYEGVKTFTLEELQEPQCETLAG